MRCKRQAALATRVHIALALRPAPRIGAGAVGAWRSLVAHLVWDQGVAGSNPAAPTIPRVQPAFAVQSLWGASANSGWFSLEPVRRPTFAASPALISST